MMPMSHRCATASYDYLSKSSSSLIVVVLAKLGARIARSRGPGQRRRAAILVSTSVVSLAAMLAGLSLVSVALTNAERDLARSPIVSLSDSRRGLPLLGKSMPIYNGRQFKLFWLGSRVSAKIPEFSNSQPLPGEAFVSPALLDDIGGPSAFTQSYGLRVSRGNSAVDWSALTAFSGEYLVFAMAPAGTPNAPSGATLLGFGFEDFPDALRPATVAGSDSRVPERPTGRPVSESSRLDERVPLRAEATSAAAVLLWVPAALLLAVGQAARSPARAERRRSLRSLGCGNWQLATVDAFESLTLTLPVCLLVTLCFWLVSGEIVAIPGGQLRFLPGDARPSPESLAIAALAFLCLAVAVAVAVAQLSDRLSRRHASRSKGVPGWVLTLPLFASLVGELLPSTYRPLHFMLLCTFIAVLIPFVARPVMRAMAPFLEKYRSAPRLIAQRRLAAGEPRVAWLVAVVTYGAFIVTLATSISFAASAPSESNGLSNRSVVAKWQSSDLRGVQELASSLEGRVTVLPVVGGTLLGDCEGVAEVASISDPVCEQPEKVTATARSELTDLVLDVRLMDWTQQPGSGVGATALARVASESEYTALQSALGSRFTNFEIFGWRTLGPSPILGWFVPLAFASVGLLLLALALNLFNAFQDPSLSDWAFSELGASEPEIRALFRWCGLSAILGSALLGLAYGWIASAAGEPAGLVREARVEAAFGVALVAAVSIGILELAVRSRRRE